jgi:ADP-ribosyl-[dinitrogen reductase] hydrolase
MVSDDTEHTCMAAQALVASGGEVTVFVKDFARRLRYWLLGLPAGAGRATLRACLKLWIGYSPERSGVFSAGNGPAMRAAVLGAAVDDPGRLRDLVRASSRVTHTDPRAEAGALAVALAAWHARRGQPPDGAAYLAALASHAPPSTESLVDLARRAENSAAAGESTAAFADSLGLSRGVSGYVMHTVPVALHAWLRHPADYRAAVMAAAACGGDADTTAAIVGGIVGAAVGRAGIPGDWLAGVREWPRTVAWMHRLGRQLAHVMATSRPARPPRLSAVGLLGRNLLFLLVVLAHGFRRLLPPY